MRTRPVNKKPPAQSVLSETIEYYGKNIKHGARQGNKISQSAGHTPFRTFLNKAFYAVKNLKIRKKDVLPVILGGIGNLAPFPGAAPAGFFAGIGINKLYRCVVNFLSRKKP